MSTQKAKFQLFQRLQALGFTYEESVQLRRIELTLQRWAEQECGDSNDHASVSIERDEKTGRPYRVVRPHNQPGEKRYSIADREAGALKRLNAIMSRHDDLISYHQSDCRGCMLYILRKADWQPGEQLDSIYTRGLAVAA